MPQKMHSEEDNTQTQSDIPLGETFECVATNSDGSTSKRSKATLAYSVHRKNSRQFLVPVLRRRPGSLGFLMLRIDLYRVG